MNNARTVKFDRRKLLLTAAGTVAIATTPLPAFAASDDVEAARQALFGEAAVTAGRVSLKLPPIAENGYSVPLEVSVDSPMTEEDHVRRIAVFAERNPIKHIVDFELGPRAGRAQVNTRIRLAGTQTITAVAEMSDGSLWSGTAETVVTLAACIIL